MLTGEEQGLTLLQAVKDVLDSYSSSGSTCEEAVPKDRPGTRQAQETETEGADSALPPPDSAPQGRGPDSNLGDSHKTGGGWEGGAGAGHVVVLFRFDHIKAKSARKTLAALAQEVCTTSTDTDAITQLTLLILIRLLILLHET